MNEAVIAANKLCGTENDTVEGLKQIITIKNAEIDNLQEKVFFAYI